MKNSIIGIILSITIGVIIIGGLLVPTITQAQDSLYITGEYSNVVTDDQIYLSPISTETSNTINIDSTGITIDSVTMPYWDDTTYGNVVLICENIFVSVLGTGTISVITSTHTVTTNATSFTAIVSAGQITYSINNGDSVSTTYSDGYIIDPDGDFVSCLYTQTKYYDSTTFSQARYNSNAGYLVFLNGVAYQDGTPGASFNLVGETVPDTDDQVSTLTSIKIANQSLTTAAVMEKSASYRYTEESGIVNLYAVIPILFITAILVMAMVSIRMRE